MVKLIVRIVAFFVIFGFILDVLQSCEGSSLEKFVDDIFSFSDNTKEKDKDKVSYDDIKNADPAKFNIYVNVKLSEINQQYVSFNTTNIDVSQTITSIDIQIDDYDQSIINQEKYINRSNINQNTLINWVTDNREFIPKLERQYQSLKEEFDILTSEIENIKKEIKSLKKSIANNRDHFEKIIAKYNKDVVEKETIKYNALQKELSERIEALTSKVETLSKDLKLNTKNLATLKKSIDKLIKKINALNGRIDKLIEQSGKIPEEVNYYYIIDTDDNLKSKGIVTSNELLGVLTVTANPNKDHFAILTDKNKTITLGREKDRFELLSDIPADSYEFRTINNKTVLIITDISNFWSKTKFLIIIKK